jgi:hypothetical protein
MGKVVCSSKLFVRTFFLFVLMVIGVKGWGQATISVGSSYTQNFNGIGTSATAALPTGWKIDAQTTARLLGTYSTAATATTAVAGVSMSSTAGGGIYNFGDNAGTDRSIGGLSASSNNKSVNVYLDLQNSGASTIGSFTISYNVEKYRMGTNAAGFSIQLYYSSDGSTWVSAGSNFLTNFSVDASNNGYTTVPGATSTISSQVITTNVASSGHIYFAWQYAVSTGTTTSNAQALGIDDISIQAIGSGASTSPSLTAAPSATVDAPFDVTYTDDATWRGAITGITVGGTVLTAGYAVSAGKITFTPSASSPAGLLQTAGTKSIVVSATNYTSASVSQAIGVGAANKLTMKTQPTAPAANGSALATQPAVYIQDQYGNTTASTASVVASATGGSNSWSLNGTTTVSGVAGTATFTDLTPVNGLLTTGATITFASAGLTGITSSAITLPDGSATWYYRSAATGDWTSTSSWESSSDNTTWSAATLAPSSTANTITIRNGHTITISTSQTVDQLTIQSGGVLSHTAGTISVSDGTGDDITINNGGVWEFKAATAPAFATNSTAAVQTGGVLRVSATGLTSAGGGINASNFVYSNSSIVEYTLTSAFSSSGVTYFPNVDASTIPIFRVTALTSNPGSAGNTVFNGVFEANASFTWAGAGTKTFRNGITGTGTLTQSTYGQWIISGSTATIGGTGSLMLGAAGLQVNAGTTLNITSSKEINTGNITINGTLSGGASASYFKLTNGAKLVMPVSNGSSVSFPVGNSSYNPVTITNNSGATDNFSVNLLDEVYSSGLNGVPMTGPRVKRTWDIYKGNSNSGSGVDFVFYWDQADVAGSLTTPALYHFENGTSWVKQTTGVTTSPTSTSLSYVGHTGTFSPFSIGDNTVTLPVSFSSINATNIGKNNKVTWSTASEEHNKGFDVQRSTDGVNYTSLGFVNSLSSTGNSSSALNYSFIDYDPIGLKQYYRLKQTDFDGTSRYSGVVVVTNAVPERLAVTSIYPNPTSSFVHLSVASPSREAMQLIVTDVNGRAVRSKLVNAEVGNNSFEVDATGLGAGVYYLSLKGPLTGWQSIGKFVKN